MSNAHKAPQELVIVKIFVVNIMQEARGIACTVSCNETKTDVLKRKDREFLLIDKGLPLGKRKILRK
jgi:hypothetical protein